MATMRAVVASGAVVLAAVWMSGCSSSSHAPAPGAGSSASSTASPGTPGTAPDGTSGSAPAAKNQVAGSGATPARPGDQCAIVCSAAGDQTPAATSGLPKYPGPKASGRPTGR